MALAAALGEAGAPCRRVHPNKVRAYAQACGLLAKTDRLDAQVLARYGAAFDCPVGRRDQDADEAVRPSMPKTKSSTGDITPLTQPAPLFHHSIVHTKS